MSLLNTLSWIGDGEIQHDWAQVIETNYKAKNGAWGGADENGAKDKL